MGCRLPKLKKAEERTSPGNIYSTLRRPQVETKVGVAYTYHFLDFLLGKEEVPVSSVLCLSSVRELPVQVRELYSEGFVLVAVHPFVHACGPDHAHIQRQLHRAVLIRETQSWERRELRWCRHRLETDVCVGGNQAADPELIQSYVKKIQDVAEQGVMFVGFLQQPGPGLSFTGQWDTDELSSLHSSPSPIHRGFSCGASPIEAPGEPQPEHTTTTEASGVPQTRAEGVEAQHCEPGPTEEDQTLTPEDKLKRPGSDTGQWSTGAESGVSSADAQTYRGALEGAQTEGSLCGGAVRAESASQQNRSSHNNNHIHLMSQDRERSSSSPRPNRSQLFALYNHTEDQDSSLRFYSLRVPLRVHKEAGLVTEVDAHWLDHMTQHFSSGAQLVDGFFHVTEENDSGVALVDSVFIFQSSTQSVNASYDAIVVEQWTVVDGVMVKADYIPLLQSLAPFGWRLMCVLPTPIVKTNSDGSLSTKQILFLQRPVLQRKGRDFKMNLRSRSKPKKSSRVLPPSLHLEMDSLRRGTPGPEEAPTVLYLPGNGAPPEGMEDETEVDSIHKSVRWTDVCRKESQGPVEEPVKIQLFSGVC
ncbi:raftlin-like [Periophthalmus magnuspinnatus]|uniref:raftlin-like n=1 Tax=Periophthalmus magnuspinnatus TaxID=409849 RepID=UPI00145A39CF|nr:raftlin-like [Periophthalmus magnuspinnatus]